MKRGWMKRAGWIAAVGALAVLAQPAPGRAALAQQDDTACHCVDADGEPIDDCTCFRTPRFDMVFAPFAARPRLGISVDTDQGDALDARGARVTQVLEEGPASEAGLEEGDVITRIDGRSLLQPLAADQEEELDLDESLPVQRLLAIARGLESGQEVEIEYVRDGATQTATVEARELSGRGFAWAFDGDQVRFDAERMRADAERLRERMRGLRDDVRVLRVPDEIDAPLVMGLVGSSRYGLELVELNEGLGTYFGTAEGVLVADVDEGSTLGLRPGDVILRVGERDVETPGRVIRILGTYGDDEEITFRIRRDGAETSVTGRLGG